MTGPHRRLVASRAHVVVESIDDPILDELDHHHLLRVLRLRDGEPVTVTDGRGGWRPCRLAGGRLAVAGDRQFVTALEPAVHIAFSVPKGDRLELIVQKLTEIGVDRMTPMATDRSIVRWSPDRAVKQMTRLRRVVREAVMQSRRVRTPVLDAVTPFAEVSAWNGARLAAPGGGRLAAAPGPILIGPEGGWSDDELARPLSTVTLGDTVLRTETAALVACALAVSDRAAKVGE